MAALGPTSAQFILQLPPDSAVWQDHQHDALRGAVALYNTPAHRNRVVAVNAMESLREARTQCAVCPGAPCPPPTAPRSMGIWILLLAQRRNTRCLFRLFVMSHMEKGVAVGAAVAHLCEAKGLYWSWI